MSVRIGLRKLSKIESYKNASDLLAHTFQYADFKHFSKSDKDIVWKLRELAIEILTNTVKGLELFPTCPKDIEMRREYFLKAIASNNALDGLLSALYGCCIAVNQPKVILVKEITDYGWEHWGELNEKQNKLLQGLIKADNEKKFDK